MDIKNSQGGWVLFDSLVGVLIVAISLMSLVAMYTQSTKITTYNRSYNNAVYLAQETLESLKQYEGKPEIENQSYNKIITKDNITYTVNLVNTLEQVSNLSLDVTHLYPYRVKVSWKDNSVNPIVEHSIQVTAYYYGEN